MKMKRVDFDWEEDEFPEPPPPVSGSTKRSRISKSRHQLAGDTCIRRARKFGKPAAKRKSRRACKEMLHTGAWSRAWGDTFTSWDII